jgi:hypothetical protein
MERVVEVFETVFVSGKIFVTSKIFIAKDCLSSRYIHPRKCSSKQ